MPSKRGPRGPSKYTNEFINAEADALLDYLETQTIPFLKDFAVKRGYNSQTVSEVFVHNPKFAEALKKYKDTVETRLVYGALSNKINATFAIFTLKNIAGWRDKHLVEHTGDISLSFSAPTALLSEAERKYVHQN